jgi:predicted secreted hydrolase
MLKRLLAGLLALSLLVAGFWYATRAPEAPASPPLTGPTPDTSGFARAFTPQDFTFPRDHGPHFDYQTEWWYYTGNVTTEAGEHFGFQLTFFRRGLTPGAPAGPAALSTNQN